MDNAVSLIITEDRLAVLIGPLARYSITDERAVSNDIKNNNSILTYVDFPPLNSY